jgi:hypothetical protein
LNIPSVDIGGERDRVFFIGMFGIGDERSTQVTFLEVEREGRK